MEMREFIKELRKRKNWRQMDLAEYLGVDQPFVSRLGGSHWELHWQVFLKIAALCDSLGLDLPSAQIKQKRRTRYIMLTSNEAAKTARSKQPKSSRFPSAFSLFHGLPTMSLGWLSVPSHA